jgi:rSAM/selenodomain-associated transferase 1
MNSTVVIVFAKAPQPGAVKTRLVPLLGPEGAAALHVKLVKHTLDTARAASFKRVELHGAPDVSDPFFRFCAGHYGVTLEAQAAGDLGARMLRAFDKALAMHDCVLLVGTDCPALAARHLRQADKALRDGADAVFVPCEDGGYALIGLRRTDRRLFDDIAWGSDHVMADTRARLQQLGWTWRELETLWDIDRPEDYARLEASGLLDTKHATA